MRYVTIHGTKLEATATGGLCFNFIKDFMAPQLGSNYVSAERASLNHS